MITLYSSDQNFKVKEHKFKAFNIANACYKTGTWSLANPSDLADKHNYNKVQKLLREDVHMYAVVTEQHELYLTSHKDLALTMLDITTNLKIDKLLQTQSK